MRSSYIHFVNLLVAILPSTRVFSLKRSLWRAGGLKVADGVSINSGARVFGSGAVVIGTDAWIGIGCTFIVPDDAHVHIGARCDIAPDVMFECGSHKIGGEERRAGEGVSAPISIGDGTWIGARAVVLGGADVGAGCIIAAGAVVTAGVYPAQSLLAGVPARVLRQLETRGGVGSG